MGEGGAMLTWDVLASIFAPRCTSSSIAATVPWCAAKWRAVTPPCEEHAGHAGSAEAAAADAWQERRSQRHW